MHLWPLHEDDRKAYYRSTDKLNWQMQNGFGNKDGFYRPIVQRLKQVLPDPLNTFEAGCRKCQSSNSWLHLWYDDLKCIHFELDIRNRRDVRAGSVLIGVHVEENPQLFRQLANYLSEHVQGAEDEGQLYGKRINAIVHDEATALQVADEMIKMVRYWVPLIFGAMIHSTRV